MQNKPNIATEPVIVKQTHHQRGARSSTTPEMRSVIQLKLRRFNTSGLRRSGRSTAVEASLSITSGAVGVSFIGGQIDIIVTLSLFPPSKPRQSSLRPAYSDSDCGRGRDNSCALSRSNNQAAGNSVPPLSILKLSFPDL